MQKLKHSRTRKHVSTITHTYTQSRLHTHTYTLTHPCTQTHGRNNIRCCNADDEHPQKEDNDEATQIHIDKGAAKINETAEPRSRATAERTQINKHR